LIGCPKLEGAQAEYVRVPLAGTTLFEAPEGMEDGWLILMAGECFLQYIVYQSFFLDMVSFGTVVFIQAQRIAKLILVHSLSYSDIFPTGCFVVKNGYEMLPEVEREGATALVIGCGPVGLCVSQWSSSSRFSGLDIRADGGIRNFVDC